MKKINIQSLIENKGGISINFSKTANNAIIVMLNSGITNNEGKILDQRQEQYAFAGENIPEQIEKDLGIKFLE